jgi:uncharacterized protein YhhL (DUF1145 family)
MGIIRGTRNYRKPNIYIMPRFMFSKVALIGLVLGFLSPVVILFEIVIGASYFINTIQCMYLILTKHDISSKPTNLVLDSIISGYSALGSFFLGRIIGIAFRRNGFIDLFYSLDRASTYPFVFLYPEDVINLIEPLDIKIKVIVTGILIIIMAFIQWKFLISTISISKPHGKGYLEYKIKVEKNNRKIDLEKEKPKEKKRVEKKLKEKKEVEEKPELSFRPIRVINLGNVIENKDEDKDKDKEKNKNDKFQRMEKSDYY